MIGIGHFFACICSQVVEYLCKYMASIQHPIKVVARRTGLSAHVIRIWEKRYGAVEPERTDTNRRLYSRRTNRAA